jgi:hypothetical protein
MRKRMSGESRHEKIARRETSGAQNSGPGLKVRKSCFRTFSAGSTSRTAPEASHLAIFLLTASPPANSGVALTSFEEAASRSARYGTSIA